MKRNIADDRMRRHARRHGYDITHRSRKITEYDFESFDLIVSLTDSNSHIVSMPLPQNDPRCRRPDISLATRLLSGWTPQVHLEEGVRRTIEYFRAKGGLKINI